MIDVAEMYDSGIKTAQYHVKRFKIFSADAGDLVNDAYIELHKSGQIIDTISLNKAIVNLCYQYNYNKTTYDKINFTNQHRETSIIFCKGCQQDLPYDMFGVTVRKKTGVRLIQTYCKDCQAKKMLACRIKKNPENYINGICINPRYRRHGETKAEGNRRRFMAYVERNRRKWYDYTNEKARKKRAAKSGKEIKNM